MPTARASRKLKQRKLAERLHALAERMVREMELSSRIEPEALMQGLQVLKMARLEAQGRRRRRTMFGPAETGAQCLSKQDAIKTALKEMRRGGVDIDRTPQEALVLLLDAYTPQEKNVGYTYRYLDNMDAVRKDALHLNSGMMTRHGLKCPSGEDRVQQKPAGHRCPAGSCKEVHSSTRVSSARHAVKSPLIPL